MDNNEKVQILKRYKILKDRVYYLENKMYNVQGVSFGDHGGGYSERTIVDDIIEKDEYIQEMNMIKESINGLKKDLSPYGTMEYILMNYLFIDGLTLDYVEKKHMIPYSMSQLRRIKKSALKRIDLDWWSK